MGNYMRDIFERKPRSKVAVVQDILLMQGNNEPEASSEFPHHQRLPFSSRISMTEPPFVPRDRLLKYQQYFQNIHKHTYLKGRYDMITSVAIPIALTASSLYLIGRGIYNMSYGIGKKE
ncbi:hypothetical protein J5N97_013828 [Dioscorea zingiberensis]|uniref:Uncharacterized protein n=1 Tax=Dioscorea zingiberensis TaxID=325984 RepID=A0A9D5CSQ6_9LILI|nr:hypothetical protein J5N97_013828 [Dioscorea zingiberensis]